MRVLVTSDLHFDHGRSSALAEAAAEEINRQAFDVLLVVGDTATSRGDALERGLGRFTFAGPKLVTLGNHELWSDEGDTLELYERVLPLRVAGVGWHCLDSEAVEIGGVGFVGSVGWYDYSFAPEYLGIPRRFYEAKISPGSAGHYAGHSGLLEKRDDIPAGAMEVFARWNDGRFVRWPGELGGAAGGDVGFTELLLGRLREQLDAMSGVRRVVAAVHHLPLRELLPPPATHAWDFAKAYLGTARFGELILEYPNVTQVFSGHSHFPGEAVRGGTRFVATGSGYREKKWRIVEV